MSYSMITTADNIRRYKSSTPSQWRKNSEARIAAQDERKKARKIAMQILNAMDEKNISEPTLAERVGVSVADISAVLKGHKVPSNALWASICSVLGLTGSIFMY